MATVNTRKHPTVASVSRITKNGRHLTYNLTVIQQPERARACGSGAKSSADRRPVDPPPVVELRIWEGKDGEPKEDVTFGYGANFFLYATLEIARPMAHGRVQPNSTPQIPVLTGMPVSGMAYLDRPSEAGYFIFPDLSVRHEGMYLLSFNLYEETKNEEDRDAETPDSQSKSPPGDSSFDWRLEIKSDMFVVYSAKKFPGLAESTSISRTVAEQGCRVRIRRDVRMRRRETKGGGDMEDQEDEYTRPNRPNDQEYDRPPPRSNSAGRGYQDAYHANPNASIAPNAPAGPGAPMGYVDQNRNDGHYPAPQGNFAQPQAPQHQYSQPPSSYQQPSQAPYERYASQPQPAHPGYGRPYPASAVEPPREQMYDQPQYRRASEATHQPHYAPQNAQYPSADSNHRPVPYQAYPPASPAILPPLRLAEKRDSIHSAREPASALPHFSPAVPSPTYDRSHDRRSSYSQYTSAPLAPAPLAAAPPMEAPRTGAKRGYDTVFSSSAASISLHNGMRPGSSIQGDNATFDDGADDDNDEEYFNQMQYKRADGTDFSRTLPSLH